MSLTGFRSCADPIRLQKICDGLGAVEVQSFLARRWLLRLPSPFTPEELQTAYRYELAFGQLEISETSVFDRPQADFNRLTPETPRAVNELVVQIAVDLGLEEGQKLRVDTTVVQTDIHHPTDSTLLWDVVRVITRLVLRLRRAVQKRVQGFHNRSRVARRRMREIQRMTPQERHERQTEKYR